MITIAALWPSLREASAERQAWRIGDGDEDGTTISCSSIHP